MTPNEHAQLLRELAKSSERLAFYIDYHFGGEATIPSLDLVDRARAAAAEIEASEKYHQGVLPMLVSETGANDEPVTEYIECSSISGGADYVDGMPRCLTLHRVMEGEELVEEIYADYVQVPLVEAPTPSHAAAAEIEKREAGGLPSVGHILRLADIIREVDGNHSLGAATLAEAILNHPQIKGVPLLARFGGGEVE